jgi:hypothetical protein
MVAHGTFEQSHQGRRADRLRQDRMLQDVAPVSCLPAQSPTVGPRPRTAVFAAMALSPLCALSLGS